MIGKGKQAGIASILLAAGLSPAAQAELSGNIGVVSKYIWRGITVPSAESDNPAVQGGFDYAHDSGFFAGWWASNLDYTYDKDGSGTNEGTGMENDFYIGYGGEYQGFNYSATLFQYYYLEVDDSNLVELTLKVGYGPFTFTVSPMLKGGVALNKGDTYLSLTYETPLPKDFTFKAIAGFYSYSDDDNSDMCYPNPAGCGYTTEGSLFQHLDLSLSHPIGDTGANMSVSYIYGNKSRDGTDQDDTVVLGVSYAFDIK